jgi:hypothetical protein
MNVRVSVIALALLSGCDQSPLDQTAEELDEARARWQQQGAPSYSYQLRYGCFCPPAVTSPVTITVVNGVTTSIVWADSGGAAPPGNFAGLQTGEQLFARIDTTIGRRPHELTVHYDPARGFPTSIVVDHDQAMADEEWTVAVSAFQVLP